MLPHLSNPPAQHSPGATGLLSEGGESRDNTQSNPESVSQRQLLRRKLTNNLTHISSPELRDNTRNTKLGIIIHQRSVGWLLSWLIGNILSLALTCPLCPPCPPCPPNTLTGAGNCENIDQRRLLGWPGQKYPAVKTLCHMVSLGVTWCHIVTGNHWPHSSPPLPFPSYLSPSADCRQKVWDEIFIVYLLVTSKQ